MQEVLERYDRMLMESWEGILEKDTADDYLTITPRRK